MISTQVSLEGRGAPYELDAWTGKINRIGHYRTAAGRTGVPVTLAPGDSTVIALGGPGGRRPGHVTAVSGGEVVMDDGAPALRTSSPGTYTVSLDDGRRTRVTVSDVAPAQTLDDWTLSVDDWRPGADGQSEITRHALALGGLKPWSDFPELRDVSGVGTYTTAVRLDRAGGAVLDLGEVTDTFRVMVNGRVLRSADQVTGRIDLGEHLRKGANTITVRVATPLRNRLRVSEGYLGQAGQPRQRYGLIGPVRLIPYGQAEIRG